MYLMMWKREQSGEVKGKLSFYLSYSFESYAYRQPSKVSFILNFSSSSCPKTSSDSYSDYKDYSGSSGLQSDNLEVIGRT